MKYHTRPFLLKELKIEVTHNCNLLCLHCSSMASSESRQEMSREKCLEIISEAASMGVRQISFSGGEPLLWKHLPDVIRLSKSFGMNVYIYTTGNVDNIDCILAELKTAGANRLMFSIFGANSNLHESVTGISGSYYKSIEAIKSCTKLSLKTEFHFVPLADNYQQLREIAELSKDIGVERVSILRLVPQGRAQEHCDKLLSLEQNRQLRKNVIELRKEGHDIRTGSPYNFIMLKEEPACFSGIDRLTIGPDLRIFPCDAFKHIPPEKLGVGLEYSTLEKYSLQDCWTNSPYLEKIREYLTTPFAEDCQKCPSLEKCLSGCPGQKFHQYGTLAKFPDPMCLQGKANNMKYIGVSSTPG